MTQNSFDPIQRTAPLSSTGQVFLTVLTHGPMCRRDVAELTGLSQGAVTRLAKPMIEAGFLAETEPIRDGPGRPMVPLTVLPRRQFAMGVKVMATEVVAVLIDLSATILASQRIPVDATDSGAVVAAVAEAAQGLPRRVRGSRSRLVGLGVGIGGHVDRDRGIVHFSPALQWPETDLSAKLRTTVGVPVVVENDANALAVYEQWFGAGRGVECFAVVTIGAGIGCGLVLEGDLFTGSTGAAGEFGHLVIDPEGPRCACGRSGCLEAMVGDDAILAAASRALGRPVESPDEVLRLAVAEDPPAREVFRAAGDALGRGLASLVSLINPELLILSGEGISRVTPMLDAMRASLAGQSFSSTAADCRLLIRPLPDETWAAGAAACMLRSGVLRSLDKLIEAG
jgi:predicted NBD/HSP70 family sugar kinase